MRRKDNKKTLNGPLDGLKIVEVANMVSAPYCGKILADLGAEVVKVEEPTRGDQARYHGFSIRFPSPITASFFTT